MLSKLMPCERPPGQETRIQDVGQLVYFFGVHNQRPKRFQGLRQAMDHGFYVFFIILSVFFMPFFICFS
jgi:hypothetical protein